MNNNQKFINIIAKKSNEDVFFVEQIEYSMKEWDNLECIEKYIKEKFSWVKSTLYDYDRKTKQKILIYNAKKYNNERVDWEYHYSNESLNRLFNDAGMDEITIETICYKEYLGLGAGPYIEQPLKNVNLLKIVFCGFYVIKNYLKPFDSLLKVHDSSNDLDEDFIKETILLSDSWHFGFVSKKDFKYKKIIEYSIMKKLGYKKLNKKWQYFWPTDRKEF